MTITALRYHYEPGDLYSMCPSVGPMYVYLVLFQVKPVVGSYGEDKGEAVCIVHLVREGENDATYVDSCFNNVRIQERLLGDGRLLPNLVTCTRRSTAVMVTSLRTS